MSRVSMRNSANTVVSVGDRNGNGVAGVIGVGGAILAGVCLAGLAKGIGSLLSAAFESRQRSIPAGERADLKSVGSLRGTVPKFEVRPSEPLESLRTNAFLNLSRQPYLVSSPLSIEPGVRKLEQARTAAEIGVAYHAIVNELEAGHQVLFTSSLIDATKRAALRSGFESIQQIPSQLATTHRFAATDSHGRTIVTEITAPLAGDVRIESEVVGVNDGTCIDILTAFDQELEAEGVRSQKPSHRPTGGVCELAAVRAFVSKKLTPKKAGLAEPAGEKPKRSGSPAQVHMQAKK